jgi:lipopolysaccharide transport system permease protein
VKWGGSRPGGVTAGFQKLNATSPASSEETTLICPSSGWAPLDVRELWRYRELLYFLVWRDVKVRYKQTVLGVAWAILQPFLTMVVFTLLFSRLAKIPSNGIPYPAFSYTALLPWTFFATGVAQSALSVVDNTNLVSRVYFPRLILPAAGVIASLLDLALAFIVLLGMLLYYHIVPGPAILTLPLFVALAFASALAAGVWLSALYVKYRDVKVAIPFLTQLWLFVTPVVYPSSLVPAAWRPLYGVNPMAGVVEGFRWALLGRGDPPGALMAVSAVAVVALLWSGLAYFRRVESEFADVI